MNENAMKQQSSLVHILTFPQEEWIQGLRRMIGQWKSLYHSIYIENSNTIFRLHIYEYCWIRLNSLDIFYYSTWPIETSNINFEKMNRRIEHITRLKADASKNYSEPFMVRIKMDVKSQLFTYLEYQMNLRKNFIFIVWKLWNRWPLLDPSRLLQ